MPPRFQRVLLALITSAATLLTRDQAVAQSQSSTTDWQQSAKIAPGGPANGFGAAIASDGDTLVVGAHFQTTPIGASSGAVHVYRRISGAWTFEQMLTASPSATPPLMGASVAISGDTLAAGAPGYYGSQTNRGAVYVFTRAGTSWTLQQLINSEAVDGFGIAVALQGDTLVVGDPMDLSFGVGPGRVTVWQRSGSAWTLQATITDPSAGLTADFGGALALDGARLVVGAPSDAALGTPRAGRVSIYTGAGATWTWLTHVNATQPKLNDEFGASLALRGDVFAVGAPGRQGPFGQRTGTASVLRITGSGAVEEAALAPLDPELNSDMRFGTSVAFDGALLAVGAPLDDMTLSSLGSLYLYTVSGSTWTWSEKLAAFGSASFLGYSATIAAGSVVAGDAPMIIAYPGSALVFEPLPTPLATSFCFGDGVSGPACPCNNHSNPGSQEGCRDPFFTFGAQLFVQGSSSVAANELSMRGRLMPIGTRCVLMSSLARKVGALFGNGLSCLEGSLVALGGRTSVYPGMASWTLDLASPGFVQPGMTRFFQVSLRSRALFGCPGPVNTSNAISVTFTP